MDMISVKINPRNKGFYLPKSMFLCSKICTSFKSQIPASSWSSATNLHSVLGDL